MDHIFFGSTTKRIVSKSLRAVSVHDLRLASTDVPSALKLTNTAPLVTLRHSRKRGTGQIEPWTFEPLTHRHRTAHLQNPKSPNPKSKVFGQVNSIDPDAFFKNNLRSAAVLSLQLVFKAPKSGARSPTWSWWLPSVPCLDGLSGLVFDPGTQYRSSRPLLLLRIKQSWVLTQLSEAKEDGSCRKLSRQACSTTRELLLNKVDRRSVTLRSLVRALQNCRTRTSAPWLQRQSFWARRRSLDDCPMFTANRIEMFQQACLKGSYTCETSRNQVGIGVWLHGCSHQVLCHLCKVNCCHLVRPISCLHRRSKMPLQSSLKDRFYLVKVALLKALANLVDGPDGPDWLQWSFCFRVQMRSSEYCVKAVWSSEAGQLFWQRRVQSHVSEVAIHLTQHFVWLKRADELRCSGGSQLSWEIVNLKYGFRRHFGS